MPEVTVEYAKPLFKRAAKAYIKGILLRNKRMLSVLMVLAAVLSLLILILLGVNMLNGCPLPRLGYPFPYLLSAVLILGVVVALLYASIYWRTINNCEKLAQKMLDRNIRLAFGQEAFRFQSELVTAEVSWKLFHKLQTGKDIWLLFPNQMTFYMLPVEVLSEEVKSLILERLKENGILIKDI